MHAKLLNACGTFFLGCFINTLCLYRFHVSVVPRMSQRQDLPPEAIVDIQQLRAVEAAFQLQQDNAIHIKDVDAMPKSSKVSSLVNSSKTETPASTKLHTRPER